MQLGYQATTAIVYTFTGGILKVASPAEFFGVTSSGSGKSGE